jgi:hypothetical protein
MVFYFARVKRVKPVLSDVQILLYDISYFVSALEGAGLVSVNEMKRISFSVV